MKIIKQVNKGFQIGQKEEGDIYENGKLIFNIRDGKTPEELLALDIKLINSNNNELTKSQEAINNKTSIILNDDQETALAQMLKWYNSNNNFATLTGSAGSGKTTIVNNFLQNVRNWEAVVTAPTHKAKKKIEESTGLKGMTVQKLLGLRPNVDIDNFNINRVQFDLLAEPEINKYKLVIIDECSMLNKDLYQLIIQIATEKHVKILFVGDELQIPPVHESKSDSITKAKNLFKLNVIIRQKESNPIRTVLAMIREDIINGTNNFRNFLKQNPKSINEYGEGYEVVSNRIEFMQHIVKDFQSSEFQYDKDHARHHAWTNLTVKSFNAAIRKILFNNDLSMLLKGDTLMAYNSIINDTGINNIINSAEYVVQEVAKGISNHNMVGYIVKVETIDSQINKSLFILDPVSYPNFTKKHNELLETALNQKGMAWRRYYAFKEQHLLIDDIKDSRGKLVVKKDIDYAYSITVHKTQGSTYGTSFISGDDIDKNQNFTERKQLWYVALSRAKTKVIIFLP